MFLILSELFTKVELITTPKYDTGYTLTKISRMYRGVYFSNQATRSQLIGRIERTGQLKDVKVITVHSGVLSLIYNHNHIKAEQLEKAGKDLAKYFQLEVDLHE